MRSIVTFVPWSSEVSVAEWLARPTTLWDDQSSNHTAGGCVYRDGYCDMQPWARAAHYCSACIPSGSLSRVPAARMANCDKDMLLTCILITISIPSPAQSFIPDLKPSFSANPSHRSLLFLLQDWLHGLFPGLFTDTSEHIRFYFLVFLFYTF